MAVRQGVLQTLERLFPSLTARQAASTPEAPQLERLSEGIPDRLRPTQPVTPQAPPVGTLPVTGLQIAREALSPVSAKVTPEQPSPPEITPPKEEPPTADIFVNDFFTEKGWTRSINRAAASDEEIKEFDRRLNEAGAAYRERFGAGAFIQSGLGNIAEFLVTAGKVIKPGVTKEDITTGDIASSIVDIAALGLPFLRIGKAGKIAKGVKEAVAVIPTPKEIAVTKLNELTKTAKTTRRELELVKSEELASRIPALEERLAAAGTLTEARQASTALQGKLIPQGTDVIPIGNQFTIADKKIFKTMIDDAPEFLRKPLTRRNIAAAMDDFLEKGVVPTKGMLENIQIVYGKAFTDTLAKLTPKWLRFGDILTNILNTPKSIVSSGDIGVTFRQMALLTFRHPVLAIKNTWVGIRSMFSQNFSDDVMAALNGSPIAEERILHGLDITAVRGGLLKGEEAFVSSWLQGLAARWGSFAPVKKVLTAPLFPVAKLTQASERAFTTTLNKMRADVWDKYFRLWEGVATDKELRAMAEVINIFSGRGAVPKKLKEVTALMNNILFSPQLQISRVQTLGLPVTLWKYPPKVRKYVIQSLVSFIATVGGTVGMAAVGLPPLLKSMGVDVKVSVGKDPRSADFAKIRIGDTRLDPWSGLQQYVVLISRLLSGEMKTQAGKIVDIDNEEALLRAFRGKEAPGFALLHDTFAGTTFLGEDFPPAEEDRFEEASNRLAPFFIRDVVEALKMEGYLGAIVAAPAWFGIGAMSYPSKTYADWLESTEQGLKTEWNDEDMRIMRRDYNEAESSWKEFFDLPSGKTKQFYREDNPNIEASMYFWGELSSLSSPEAVTEFKRLAAEFEIPEEIYPIRDPLETFEEEGKTESETRAALLDTVPTYLSNFIRENPKQFKDNLPETIRNFEQAKDKDRGLITKYLNDTKGFDNSERVEYRRDNPEIDAVLNFWGRVSTLQSRTALALLREKADILGVPEDIIPGIIREEELAQKAVDKRRKKQDSSGLRIQPKGRVKIVNPLK